MTDATPDETTPPTPTTTDGPAWRPFGYADPRTGTTEAAGAEARPLRYGPEVEDVRSGEAGADVAAAPGSDVAAAQLPDVLVPDDEATRIAESHPNVAPLDAGAGAGDEAGGAGQAVDDESGELRASATVDGPAGAAAPADVDAEGAPADVEPIGAADAASLVDVERAAGETETTSAPGSGSHPIVEGADVAADEERAPDA